MTQHTQPEDPVRTEVENHIGELLAKLGSHESAVAQTLLDEGCHGCQKDGTGCPVWQYLVKNIDLPIITHIHVDEGFVEIEYGGEFLTMKQPDPVSDFIHNFDRNDEHLELLPL